MSVVVRSPAVPPDLPADGHVVLDAPAGPRRSARRRPNLSGDLRTMLQEPPTFRRSLRGYDRLQVDNYVRWAEEELAADARTLDDQVLRHTRLRADLDEAHRQLHHSAAGREFLHLASRVGAVLCVAADQADTMREQAAADAQRITEEATAEAERISAETRVEAAARLAKAGQIERRAREEAARLLAQAETEAEALELRCTEAHAYLDRTAGQLAEVLGSLGTAAPEQVPEAAR